MCALTRFLAAVAVIHRGINRETPTPVTQTLQKITAKITHRSRSPTERATGLFSPLDSSIVNTFPSFRGRARDRLTTEQNRAARVISFLPRSNCQLLLAPSPSPSYCNTRTSAAASSSSAAASASSSPWAAAWRRWFEWSVLLRCRCRLATD